MREAAGPRERGRVTMDTSSPFVLLRTANGLVSIDARTIAGNIGRFEREPHVLLLETTTSTPFTLKFASCAEADAAVERLHVAREKVAALPDLAALLAEVHHEPPTEPPMVVDARR